MLAVGVWGEVFMFGWIRNLYDRVMQLSGHPRAPLFLAIIAFLESSVFPIPPDVLLLPLCLAQRERAFRLGLICTVASVLGGIAGYALGFYAFDTVGTSILDFYGAMDRYDAFADWYQAQGTWVVFIAGFTPIPYKVITISAGVFQFHFFSFVVLSVLSRGLRFAIEVLLVYFMGEKALIFIDRHFNKLTILGGVAFVGGFFVLKLFLH